MEKNEITLSDRWKLIQDNIPLLITLIVSATLVFLGIIGAFCIKLIERGPSAKKV